MTNATGRYIHYGCGLTAPEEWENFDVSPTLRIQKNVLLKTLFRKQLNTTFPENVRFGNIIKGLPIEDSSCEGVYCSHVLEHLALEDFRKALVNTYRLLKPGGIFRCVVPDLEFAAKHYLNELAAGKATASITFIGSSTLLGKTQRPKGFKNVVSSLFGNSQHLWMWDKFSLSNELKAVGFKDVRECRFNDCRDPLFNLVEDEKRFRNAVALEAIK